MKHRCIILLIVAASGLVAPALFADYEGVGQEDIMRTFRRDHEKARDVALHNRDERVAGAAFAAYVRGAKDPTSEDCLALMRRFAADDDRLYRAAFILAHQRKLRRRKRLQPIAEKLAASRDVNGVRLAAALCATANLSGYITEQKAAQQEKDPDAEDKKKKKKKKKRRRRGPRFLNVPESLFDKTHRGVIPELTARAAAFAGNEKQRATFAAVFGDDPDFAGSVLLYRVRTEDELAAEDVRRLFVKTFRGGSRSAFGRDSLPPVMFSPKIPSECLACVALAEYGDPELGDLAVKALDHDDRRVRMEAVRTIRKLNCDEGLPQLAGMLKEASGSLAVELCRAFAEMPNKNAVPVLLDAYEKDNGWLRLHYVYALSAIAGKQRGRTAEDWREWWKKAGSEFTVDAAASAAYRRETDVEEVEIPSHGYFYGLPIYSNRLAYVVDTSLSMRGDRIKSLRENMAQSLRSLEPEDDDRRRRYGRRDDGIKYNIVDFGGDVVPMDADELTDDLDDGIERAQEMPLTLGTRTYDAIERALVFGETDTLYLLSDGAPVWGQLENWQSIIDGVTYLTYYRPIAIYSVAFAPKRGAGDMKNLADGHYGAYDAPL